jgi:tripartite-type tricarboxylate transporter receptor subunit TctC
VVASVASRTGGTQDAPKVALDREQSGGMVSTLLRTLSFCCQILIGTLVPAAAADDAASFYQSHALRIVIGHEVGTGFDLYARLLARYLGNHLAGHPTVIPENMVGAAGLVAANWLYNAAPKDGSAIAIFAHTAAFDPLLGDSKGRYDGTQFTWIGNMDSVVGLCGVWQDSGIAGFDDLFSKQTLFGSAGSGTAGPLTQFPTALRNLLGVKIKLIQGYRGSADIRLAMTRGEVHGVCGIPLSTVKTEWRTTTAPDGSSCSCSSATTRIRHSATCRMFTNTPRPTTIENCST